MIVWTHFNIEVASVFELIWTNYLTAARSVKAEPKCEQPPEPEQDKSVDQVDTDMSACYSEDNSDDDFKLPTKKRSKVSCISIIPSYRFQNSIV